MTGRTDGGQVVPSAAAPVFPSAAAIQRMIRVGDHDGAASAVGALVEAGCGRAVGSVTLTLDEYSLNSVSGRVRFEDGSVEFFKFHHEEGEERNVSEYYRARLLSDAGLPVEVPLAVVTEPGRQFVLYEVRTEPRLADLCADLERRDGAAARLPPNLAVARRALDAAIGSVMVATAGASGGTSASAAIHQLFHHRLTDGGRFPGGRYRRWYLERAEFERLADCRLRVNGVTYDSTLRELAERAAARLHPDALAAGPVVTAHGDDHQGNIWVLGAAEMTRLVLFDPAFASGDVPALLAPVKATFHNVFAHPFWLYHPTDAAARTTLTTRFEDSGGEAVLVVDDDAALSTLRHQVLDSVAELVWAPLLASLADRDLLPDDWRATVRAALFCCPLLVTDLLATTRAEPVRLLGLARAVMAGSEPLDGTDDLTEMLDAVTPC